MRISHIIQFNHPSDSQVAFVILCCIRAILTLMPQQIKPFWETKSLSEMTVDEWESLCDGCGRCCLNKLEDVETGKVYFTNIACRLLDENNCRCRDYSNRKKIVPECLVLNADSVQSSSALPNSCAYRRLAEGKKLPTWHPLVCNNSDVIHREGISVQGKTVSEKFIHIEQFEDHIVDWFN